MEGAKGVRQVQVSLAELRDLAEKQIEKAAEEKGKGSRAFGENDLNAARESYVNALSLIAAVASIDACKRDDFRDIASRVEVIEMLCHSNLAACALQENKFEEALDESRAVLSIDEKNVKALYRAGKALSGLSRFQEAVDALEKASSLNPSDRSIQKLLHTARKDMRETNAGQRATFGGMFSKSSYIRSQNLEDAMVCKQNASERKALQEKLNHCISGSKEVSLLERWADEGIRCCEPDEKQTLVKLAQRAAAAGRLNSADDREKLSKHGLSIVPSDQSRKGNKEEENDGNAEEQQELFRVKTLSEKFKNGEQLSSEEAEFLVLFKKKEVVRLEGKLKTEGLSQSEHEVLDAFKEQLSRYESRKCSDEERKSEVEELLKLMNSGRRVPIRQRLKMDQILSEERIRLEEKDDDVGLSSEEWSTLKNIQKWHKEKQKGEDSRRTKLEQRKRLAEMTQNTS